MQWIEHNKEWFLSGAGLFLVSSVVSFASVILTLWWKSRAERRRKKKLRVSVNLTRFSVPSLNFEKNISQEHVKVSYKGTEYENLCIYSAIVSQKLHFILPLTATIVDVF